MEVVFPSLLLGSTRDERNLAVIFQMLFSLEGNLFGLQYFAFVQ